eukprot:705964-Pelagomonas_calceolata.AAC.4
MNRPPPFPRPPPAPFPLLPLPLPLPNTLLEAPEGEGVVLGGLLAAASPMIRCLALLYSSSLSLADRATGWRSVSGPFLCPSAPLGRCSSLGRGSSRAPEPPMPPLL